MNSYDDEIKYLGLHAQSFHELELAVQNNIMADAIRYYPDLTYRDLTNQISEDINDAYLDQHRLDPIEYANDLGVPFGAL